jgi:hypothetical protein
VADADQHDVRPGRFETRHGRSIPEAVFQIV